MPNVSRMIAVEGNTSGSQDELVMLVASPYLRRLALAVIDRLYQHHQAFFIHNISSNPTHTGEYDFDILNRAFAESSVVAVRQRSNGQSRYFKTVYIVNNTPLYLDGDWYAISKAKPKVTNDWLSINDLIRVLNKCFKANFVYIVTDNKHQIWGPSGTL